MEYRMSEGSMLMPTVDYLVVIGCEHDATNRLERNDDCKIGRIAREIDEGLRI